MSLSGLLWRRGGPACLLNAWRQDPVAIRRIATLGSTPAAQYVKAGDRQASALPGRRPLSPHLTIYEPQLTWLMSIAHRMTGAALSTGIYAFGLYYALAQPSLVTAQAAGWLAHDCPVALFVGAKYLLAAPFVYHTLNGLRHLVWDMAWGLSLKHVYLGGWLVNLGTVLGAGLLAFLY